MKLQGTTIMHAPPATVWAALTDPAVLVEAIPGCQRLESSGPDAYRFTITAGIASLHGVYTGDVAISDQREPGSFVLTASGAGGPGTVSVRVLFRLGDAGGGSTELGYEADGVVGGLIAGVGQRMVTAVAQRMAGDFFRSVDDRLVTGPSVSGNGAAGGGPDAARPADGESASGPAAYVRDAGSGRAGFVRGVLVGTAATLAGVAIGGVIKRRSP
jgi:carbon monoxide dehydrogenase subunit G